MEDIMNNGKKEKKIIVVTITREMEINMESHQIKMIWIINHNNIHMDVVEEVEEDHHARTIHNTIDTKIEIIMIKGQIDTIIAIVHPNHTTVEEVIIMIEEVHLHNIIIEVEEEVVGVSSNIILHMVVGILAMVNKVEDTIIIKIYKEDGIDQVLCNLPCIHLLIMAVVIIILLHQDNNLEKVGQMMRDIGKYSSVVSQKT